MTQISPQRLPGIKKKFADVTGRRICYLEAGSPNAYPIIMIPGWMGSSIDLPTFFPFMAKRYHCFVLDMPGYGESDPLPTYHSIKAYADFIEAYATKLGLTEFYLVGNCLGGSIALQYVLNYERAKKVSVFTPVYWGETMRGPIQLISRSFYLPLVRWLYDYIIHHRWTMRVWARALLTHANGPYKEDAMEKKLNASTRAAMESMKSLWHIDLRSRLGEIKIPVNVLLFDDDRVLRPGTFKELKQYIPQADIVVAKDKGHMANPDDMYGEYSKILRFFQSSH